MAEARVAFPNDETSAEVMASRLRDAGIAARVDRGLYGTYQGVQRNQITVLVDERHAKRARKLLGTTPADRRSSDALLRAAVIVVVVAIALGVAVIAVLLTR